jgi:hypothetical protein
MRELVRTSDPVLLSVIEAILTEAALRYLVADRHISALEGMIGAFPRRVLVVDEHATRARQLLRDAGLAKELRADD